MNNEELIKLTDVAKKFGKTVILKDVNFSIYKGQSIALVGNNGVGKSTLLKMISGLSSVTAGNIAYTSDLLFHYVPEHFARSKLSVTQYLELMIRIDDIAPDVRHGRIESLLKDFFMEHMADTPLDYLSKGSLQKVGVIQALLTPPDILLLDEPLSGQDANSQRVFIAKMKDLLATGVTIIMSCHEKYLVNEISDTVIEIKNGQIELMKHEKYEISERYVLVFIDEKGELVLPEFDFPMDRIDKRVKMYVDWDRTDEVISMMMNNGWSLRSMYHEKNN